MQGMGRENRLRIYNRLQLAMMERFVARGGTLEEWCATRAAAFRRRFGWLLALEAEAGAERRGQPRPRWPESR
jgi:hypothetical protein